MIFMKNKFLSFLQKETNITYTENGATALKTTNSSLLDLFGTIGSLRARDESEIERLFSAALAEDTLLATKMAFYARNIRGGLGERRTFRVILKYLATLAPEIVIKNFDAIALLGRYDDFYTLVDTPVEEAMWTYLKEQFTLDLGNYHANEPISLLAKWLKSVNASSDDTTRLGKLTAKRLGLSEKAYRQTLSKLRKYIDVTEVKMSGQNWSEIAYGHVPSRAMFIYHKAFKAHDEEGFTNYLNAVIKGEAKVNASTLYPYDILEQLGLSERNSNFSFHHYDALLEEQWKSLPNYVTGEQNVLVMADTSGSMRGRPIHSSIGLALYFAERNKGAFKDTFMTFSSRPSLIKVKGNTLYDKIKCIPAIVENTDLEAAFNLILTVAVKNKLSTDELPASLVIITDMEFDFATTSRGNWTFYDSMVKNYAAHGYAMPNVIFWNVNSRNDVFQVTSNYKGVQMASGQSPSVFKSILANIGKTPYDAMLSVLNDPMYDLITV